MTTAPVPVPDTLRRDAHNNAPCSSGVKPSTSCKLTDLEKLLQRQKNVQDLSKIGARLTDVQNSEIL